MLPETESAKLLSSTPSYLKRPKPVVPIHMNPSRSIRKPPYWLVGIDRAFCWKDFLSSVANAHGPNSIWQKRIMNIDKVRVLIGFGEMFASGVTVEAYLFESL